MTPTFSIWVGTWFSKGNDEEEGEVHVAAYAVLPENKDHFSMNALITAEWDFFLNECRNGEYADQIHEFLEHWRSYAESANVEFSFDESIFQKQDEKFVCIWFGEDSRITEIFGDEDEDTEDEEWVFSAKGPKSETSQAFIGFESERLANEEIEFLKENGYTDFTNPIRI